MSASYCTEGTLSMDVLVSDMQATYEPELFAAAMVKRGAMYILPVFTMERFS
jgi:hypothetical protein